MELGKEIIKSHTSWENNGGNSNISHTTTLGKIS